MSQPTDVKTERDEPTESTESADERDPWEGIPLAVLAGAVRYDTDTAGGCG